MNQCIKRISDGFSDHFSSRNKLEIEKTIKKNKRIELNIYTLA